MIGRDAVGRACPRGGARTIPVAALSTAVALLGVTPATASPRPPRATTTVTLPSGERVSSAWMRPHLDRSRALVGADRARSSRGLALTGRGVVIGLVDAGVDVAHPDLRTPEGATRVAWMLDYASRPAGLHPELEARFAVDTERGRRGAVLSRDDLDASLRTSTAPGDPLGHGTHALSIALGGGGPSRRYVGVAPEATAVVVRASLRDDAFEVPDALAATGVAFVFDRAAAMSMPAVAALSLGTHRGAHDGDGPLERALAALVRDGDAPGRAVVASAGNGGGRRVHARMELARGATTPLTLRATGAAGVSIAYAGALSLSARWPGGVEGERVPTGASAASRHPANGSIVSITNATDGASPVTGARVADVMIEGAGGTYTLLLRGSGRVDAWVSREGDAGDPPEFLAPYGDFDASVEVPATSPSVIAVGALTTRAERPGSVYGAVADFSSRGPSRAWALKPDLVAPGDVVIAALSSQAASNHASPFSDPSRAADAWHAAASGTSAAAPHVAGALALLFEEAPAATQRELVAALTAGDAPWSASRGWSTLDIPRALVALHRDARNPASRVRSSCAAPMGPLVRDERAVIACRALDGDGAPTAAALALTASAGVVGEVTYLGAGRYAIDYRAPLEGDRVALSVSLDGALLARWDLALTAGPGTSEVTAWGGCSARRGPAGGGLATMLLAAVMVVRSRGRVARPARERARRARGRRSR